MKIRGREIHFRCTVEAHHKISALADDNNIQTVLNILRSDSNTVEMYSTAALFAVAMSEGYEDWMHWENPDYVQNPLTLDEINHLVRKDFDQLYTEAVDAFLEDIGVTVETEEPKGKKETGDAESA